MEKIVAYFREAKAELQKVAWPSRAEATKHTLLVIGISLGLAAFLGALDYIFNLGIETVINRW